MMTIMLRMALQIATNSALGGWVETWALPLGILSVIGLSIYAFAFSG